MTSVSSDDLEFQIEELKNALGNNERHTYRRLLGLPDKRAILFSALMRNEILSHEAASAILYSDKRIDDRAENEKNTIATQLTKLRKQLKPYGIKISTSWGTGHFLTPEMKQRVRAVLQEAEQMAPLIEIEKGIPVPNSSMYPFEQMKVGDSFVAYKTVNAMRVNCHNFKKRKGYDHYCFVVKQIDENKVRVWRDQDHKGNNTCQR